MIYCISKALERTDMYGTLPNALETTDMDDLQPKECEVLTLIVYYPKL